MSFTPKTWVNSPSTSTPISAAALIDAETRLSDYTDSKLSSVLDFGADPTGVSDSTAAIQAAIDSFAQAGDGLGGTVFFPAGEYLVDGQLDLDDKIGITVVGESAWGYYTGASSIILFSRSDANPCVSLRSARGVQFRNLCFRYTSASYTGKMFKTGHSGGNDTTGCSWENCTLQGTLNVANGAFALIDLPLSIFCFVKDCVLQFAQRGIRTTNNDSGYEYSNAHVIRDSVLDNLAEGAIINAGEAISVRGCTFEGTNAWGPIPGGSSMTRVFYDEDGISGDINFTDCWIGDAVYVTNWFDTTSPVNLMLNGNTIQGGNKIVSMPNGGKLIAIGNSLGNASGDCCIDFTPAGSDQVNNAVIMGNSVSGADAVFIRGGEQTTRSVVLANGGAGSAAADETSSNWDRLVLNRPIIRRNFDLGPIGGTIQAAAGSGATVDMGTYSFDHGGSITLHTGTGTSTGDQVNVTFQIPMPLEAVSGSDTRYTFPHIVLTPSNALAAKADVYAIPVYDGVSAWATFSLNAATALDASSTYVFQYTVVR